MRKSATDGRGRRIDARAAERVRADASPCPGAMWRYCARLLATLAEWQERAEQRAHLARLDERMLKDIGVSAVDAWNESRKPFWEP